MRRRKIKDADKKLLMYDGYIIDGLFDIDVEINGENTKKYIVEDERYKYIKNELHGRWNEYFGNNNPIHIEVGTGKGQFITTLARLNPNINYIGLEIKEEVLLRAVEKADNNNLSNIGFIWGNVEFLDEYFSDMELDRIYINFCDPWPKKKHERRRLTYKDFLELYRKKLTNSGDINFKTDNRGLFEFSLNEFSGNDWMLKNISLDLKNSDFKENVTTEYEDKFMSMNMPIYRLEAVDIRK